MTDRVPRAVYQGRPKGWKPDSESDHFMRCPECGAWFDMRDLGAAFDHDGPLPHPVCDQPQ